MKYNAEHVALLRPLIREILGPGVKFDMTGYENSPGQCTLLNQEILNRFACLGIYDYTHYLFLDFHKGCGSLYLKYWDTGEVLELESEFGGWTTSEIIALIYLITVGSGRRKRRRE
jgi:hypothetical protein